MEYNEKDWYKYVFIYCPRCRDIKKLQRRKVYCECRQSFGWLHKRYRHFSVYGGMALPLTLPSNMLKKNIIDENKAPKIKCPECKKTIHSLHRHDYQTCKCQNLSLDGGFDYRRINASPEVLEKLKKQKKKEGD